MTDRRPSKRVRKPRITLTKRDLRHLFEAHATHSPAVLAKRTGLPYMLVYNVVHGRVASVSNRHYQLLFGGEASPRAALKVDGGAFRALAELWLFLHDEHTQADLYRELHDMPPDQKPDHRIFNGKINFVEARLEHRLRHKFHAAGVDESLLEQWLEDFENLSRDDYVGYDRIRPVLIFLQDNLGVHPTALLKQSVVRYESGELKRISRRTYERAVGLKRQVEKALAANQPLSLEKIRDAVVGGKKGYTLYSEVQEELNFLRRFAKKGAKRYLGRAAWTYEHRRAKRIADWRARKIMHDCDRFIGQTPSLRLAELPRSRQALQLQPLLGIMLARSAQLLSDQDGIDFEKRILKPIRPRDEYSNQYHGFTPFDMASSVLGMKRKAFDLMVAKNCEIFRTVGKFNTRWYLSDLYLRELSKNEYFDLISAKYELLAKRLGRSRGADACLQ
jgi:hypothetical protein